MHKLRSAAIAAAGVAALASSIPAQETGGPAKQAVSSALGVGDASAASGIRLTPVSSMVKVFRELEREVPPPAVTEGFAGQSFRPPWSQQNMRTFLAASAGNPLELDGARGEYVHGQVVVVAQGKDARGLRWSAEPLCGPGSAQIPVSVRLVGYVNVKKESKDSVAAAWWPDPLLSHLDAVDVNLGYCQPLWVTVAIPRDAKPGAYRGKLVVSVGGATQAATEMRLRVREFEIPKERHLRIAASYEEGVGPMLYGGRWNDELKWRYRQFVLDHRLNVHSIYQWDMPMLRHMAGESVADLKRLWEAGQNVFFVHNFTHDFTPEWSATVDRILEKSREAGIPDEALWFYGYDEVTNDKRPEMISKVKKIKTRYPQIRTMTTAAIWNPSKHRFDDLGAADGLAELVDAWVPIHGHFANMPDSVAAARARGKEVWWYFCNVPGHPYPNWFVDYPAIEARLVMGMMPWKYQPDGFLYYSWNRLNWDAGVPPAGAKLIDDGPLCRWDPQTGDGCVFYEGIDGPVSTIRLENITDGIEDYEYFWVLRDLVKKVERGPLGNTDAGRRALANARYRLIVPITAVETLTAYTGDPNEVERTRSAVADAIEAILGLAVSAHWGNSPPNVAERN